jgi:hypothetical protein
MDIKLNSDLGMSIRARLSPAAIAGQLQCTDCGDRMQLLARDVLKYIATVEGLLSLARLEAKVEQIKASLTPKELAIMKRLQKRK